MLVEFSAENFGSIRDEQTISFVASRYYKDKSEWLIESDAPGLKGESVLKAISIYGPNASGKSTFVDALGYLRWLVRNSAGLMPDDALRYYPFRLDAAHRAAPTTFKIIFIVKRVRYDYEVSYLPGKVCFERLERYETGRAQLMFERYLDEEGDPRLTLTGKMSGLRKLEEFLASKPTALVLSRAAQEGFAPLLPPYNWMARDLRLPDRDAPGQDLSSAWSIIDGSEGEELRKSLIEVMSHADLGIVDIRSERELLLESMPGLEHMFQGGALEQLKGLHARSTSFMHSTVDGDVEFDAGYESDGTMAFLCLVADVLMVLRDGSVLMVDELDRSLHPALVNELLRMFAEPSSNGNGAQLLFTSHDPQLMDALRRDQVWLTTKGRDGASTIEPLSDYAVRKGERKSLGYELGRYGAVPYVDDLYARLVGA